MAKVASYVLSAYSFIHSLTQEDILDVGHGEKNGHPIPSFDEKALIDLCTGAQAIFKSEDNVLDIEGDVIVVGDIHGSLHDLLRIIKYIEDSNSKAVFLGDYVDRGNFSLECMTLLFGLKILKPDIFFLIRGNHEFDYACRQYGFRNDIVDTNMPSLNSPKPKATEEQELNPHPEFRYKNYHIGKNCYQYTEKLYDEFMNTFSYMPISAIVNHSTFCIHGGLSPLLKSINDIRTEIQRPVFNYEENELLRDLLWSDPSNHKITPYRENQRGTGCSFNWDAVRAFLSTNNLKRIIRGHQCIKKGISHQFDRTCYTVFSASLYGGNEKSQSAVIKIMQIDDSLKYERFPPIQRLKKKDTVYKKVQPFSGTEQIKCQYYSMKHPKILFKGNTPKLPTTASQPKFIPPKKTSRDSQSIKLHCHVNPALMVNHRKSMAYSLVHNPLSHDYIILNNSDIEGAHFAQQKPKMIKHTVSLPGSTRHGFGLS